MCYSVLFVREKKAVCTPILVRILFYCKNSILKNVLNSAEWFESWTIFRRREPSSVEKMSQFLFKTSPRYAAVRFPFWRSYSVSNIDNVFFNFRKFDRQVSLFESSYNFRRYRDSSREEVSSSNSTLRRILPSWLVEESNLSSTVNKFNSENKIFRVFSRDNVPFE